MVAGSWSRSSLVRLDCFRGGIRKAGRWWRFSATDTPQHNSARRGGSSSLGGGLCRRQPAASCSCHESGCVEGPRIRSPSRPGRGHLCESSPVPVPVPGGTGNVQVNVGLSRAARSRCGPARPTALPLDRRANFAPWRAVMLWCILGVSGCGTATEDTGQRLAKSCRSLLDSPHASGVCLRGSQRLVGGSERTGRAGGRDAGERARRPRGQRPPRR